MNHTKKKVSLQTIADQLGVSKFSVSLAINNKPGVGNELREKILKTADELGYQKTKRNTDNRSNKNILVLIPEYIRNDISFYNTIYWAIENEIKERGYNAILTSVDTEMEEHLLLPSVYDAMGCIGMIAVGVLSEAYIKRLMELKQPLISVDQYYDSIALDSINAANEEGAYQTVRYLIECGHKDIGFIGALGMTSRIYGRWFGYYKAMTEANHPICQEHCITANSPLNTQLHDQDELEYHLNQMPSFPSAWFCAGDMVAIALINVLKKRNLDIPNDISVAAFDDIEPASIIVPTLTTYNVPRNLMGRTAVSLLLAKIENPQGVKRTVLHGSLVIRDSVKKLN